VLRYLNHLAALGRYKLQGGLKKGTMPITNKMRAIDALLDKAEGIDRGYFFKRLKDIMIEANS